MAYLEQWKADEVIFLEPIVIDVGSIVLTFPNPNLVEQEAAIYYANSCDEELKRRMPGAYVDSIKNAEQKLKEFISRTLLRQDLLLCIRPKTTGIPIGYIVINSPISSTGLKDWSVDFWMGPAFQNRKLMKPCLNNVLSFLQKMKVPLVKALVDSDNIRSIKILTGLNFIYQHKINGFDKNDEFKEAELYYRKLMLK
ncbi:MAG TPA: GNAT family protein [Chitinophagales bacterium]|nr:GNAT family protein [Chitinophagales bacterium]